MARRKARQYDEESLGLTSTLLESNPECYTVWNYRREMLRALFADKARFRAAQSEG
jgi:geranylgeranyl transferase type-2 subunit alpha